MNCELLGNKSTFIAKHGDVIIARGSEDDLINYWITSDSCTDEKVKLFSLESGYICAKYDNLTHLNRDLALGKIWNVHSGRYLPVLEVVASNKLIITREAK